MANYLTADLIKYQAKILGQYQAGELRVREPKVFNSLRSNTELMIPSHNAIKNAAKRTDGEVNFFARSNRSLGTGGEIYNHTGTKGDSAVIIPSWAPKDDKFGWSIKQANSSLFNLDDMLMNEMVNLNNNFTEGLESASVDWLFDNRSGVNVYASQGSFNGTNDAFEITEDFTNPTSTGLRAVQIVKSAMVGNKWSGALVAYCDTVFFDKMQFLNAQGSGNQINTEFQYSGIRFIKSYELDAKAIALGYTQGFCIVEEENNTTVLDWIPETNRIGHIGPDNIYSTMIHPTTGLPLATHQYAERANETANGGENQDVREEFQAFTYLSFNASPLTKANETPLQAFALVASA